jgi:hypothetical protein
MAVTPTGVDMITSISRRILREEATDVFYLGSPWTWRLWAKNKVVRRGGLHIESRFIYTPWSTGGFFYGPEVLNVEPSDPEISGAWEWKEVETNVTIDQRSLIRADSEYAVANYVIEQCEIAKMDLRDKIAYGVWSDGTNFKVFDGMFEIVDNGTISTTYGGLTRASYPFLNAQVDSTTTVLGLGAMNSLWDLCTKGARAPKLTVSIRANLTRFENLLQAQVQYTQPTAVVDQTFASGGFSGGWYRNQPWMVDEHIPSATTEGNLFFLNDDYFELVINENGDFVVHPFQMPTNQFVITSLTYVAGNIICTNPQVQGKFTALTA